MKERDSEKNPVEQIFNSAMSIKFNGNKEPLIKAKYQGKHICRLCVRVDFFSCSSLQSS